MHENVKTYFSDYIIYIFLTRTIRIVEICLSVCYCSIYLYFFGLFFTQAWISYDFAGLPLTSGCKLVRALFRLGLNVHSKVFQLHHDELPFFFVYSTILIKIYGGKNNGRIGAPGATVLTRRGAPCVTVPTGPRKRSPSVLKASAPTVTLLYFSKRVRIIK